MVLCPFVFLLRHYDVPSLRLDGSEVSSAHWVPLRALIASSSRTVRPCDVVDRTLNRGKPFRRWLCRAALGKMIFAAVRLVPSESVYDTLDYQHDTIRISGDYKTAAPDPAPDDSHANVPTDQPLLLWGITLGIIVDFFDLVPSSHEEGIRLWHYPTFSAPDVRFWLSILSRPFRQRKERELIRRRREDLKRPGHDVTLTAAVVQEGSDFAEISKPSQEQRPRPTSSPPSKSWSGIVGFMFDGYYDIVRRAIVVALIGRSALLAALIVWAWRRRKSRLSHDISRSTVIYGIYTYVWGYVLDIKYTEIKAKEGSIKLAQSLST